LKVSTLISADLTSQALSTSLAKSGLHYNRKAIRSQYGNAHNPALKMSIFHPRKYVWIEGISGGTEK